MTRLDRAVARHLASARQFAARVERVSAAEWLVPLHPGKWSPAEEALHIRQVYDVMMAALAGGPGLRPRVSPVTMWFIHHVGLPILVALDRLPRGVRAPREVEPDAGEAAQSSPADRAEEIRQRASSLEAALDAVVAGGGTVALRHPYFGALDHLTARQFIALHTHHHLRHFTA